MTKKTNSGAANSNATEKKTPQISAAETANATGGGGVASAKPLESDFDLLSLSQQSTQQTVTTKLQ